MEPETVLPHERRNPHLERLVEFSRKLSNLPDLKPFLDSLVTAAAELTNSELAFILEPGEDKDQLYFLTLPSSHQEQLSKIEVPKASSLAGWVLQNGKPAVILNSLTDPRHFNDLEKAAGFTTQSLMAVPICYKGDVLGVLEVVNKSEQAHYTEEDLRILEILGSQAAIAIQNDHLESKVKLAADQKDQLDRMKSDFIAIASHELRTPLGIILGHATFLRETLPAEQRNTLEVIVQNAMRLKEIIYDLANMDNAQTGMAIVRSHPISMKTIVDEVMDSVQNEAKDKQLTLHAETGQGDLLLDGDSSKITTALGNLVKNAITFSNPGGHIDIIAISIPGYVKVTVKDDGIGIPVKDLPHIFERFYQVESHLTRKHGGMGLGLSVAQTMVEMHRGRIWAESVEGKGSSFTFLLPVNSNQADAASRNFTS
jgi:signal transduction histidine kinase